MTILEQYGWNHFHQQYFSQQKATDLSVGRIISIQGFKHHLITEKGELETELSGKLLYGASSEDLPKVGDWVTFIDYGAMGYIVDVFPRTNALTRKSPGTTTEKQVLAANVDYALIVQGLDNNFNLMRLERYIVQIKACSITPVVVLNKADLVDDIEHYRNESLKLQRDCNVILCSTYSGFGLNELKQLLIPCCTYILVGSSGVGKSSLLNALSSAIIQQTSEISEVTSKGKHTTTTRDLFRLSNGSLVIDTPGMREFGVTFEEGNSSAELFPALQEFARHCHFSDCQHINETGCAVIAAVQSGDLSAESYNSYIKLMKEQKRFQIKAGEKKRLGKQMGKMVKEAKNFRKKYKY